eukprot:2091339-Prymnesium_polylepis.1
MGADGERAVVPTVRSVVVAYFRILRKRQYCTYYGMGNTCRKDSIAHTRIRSIADTWTGQLFGLARTE